MKTLKKSFLLFAAAFFTLAAVAQSSQDGKSSTSQPNSGSTTSDGNKTRVKTPVRKETQKTTTKPDGTSTTVTKSRPTKKKDISKTN